MPVPLPRKEISPSGPSPVTHTRFIGLAVENHARIVDFYRHTWGLELTDHDTGLAYFAAAGSEEHHVLRIRAAESSHVDVLSLAVATRVDVDHLAEKLARADTMMVSQPADLDGPGGGYGFRFFDPDGRLIEVSADVATRTARTLEEREDIPKKLSHVVFNTENIKRVVTFYERLLGFRVSDWVEHRMVFMRCGRDHHTIGFATSQHSSLNHVSFEMRGLEEYMRGTGRLMRGGLRNLWGPGRHGPGDNTFSYFHAPDGNVMEYTTALLQVDDESWTPCRWEADGVEADQWGTAGPIDEFIPAATGTQDQGLWIPAPI